MGIEDQPEPKEVDALRCGDMVRKSLGNIGVPDAGMVIPVLHNSHRAGQAERRADGLWSAIYFDEYAKRWCRASKRCMTFTHARRLIVARYRRSVLAADLQMMRFLNAH